MIYFTPTDAAKVANNPPQGATPSTSQLTAGGLQSFNPNETPPAPVVPPAPLTAGQTLVKNLKQVPGQLLDAGKSLFKTATAGSDAIGESIGTAALDVNKLAHGQNPDIPVDIPKTIGGYLEAGSTFAGGAIARGAKEVAAGAKTIGSIANATQDTAKIIETVSPKLTAKETAAAAASRGTKTSGFLNTISLNPDPAATRIAETIKQFVPDFNPAKPLTENINSTKDAIGNLAQDLKNTVIQSGKDRIYSFKELGSALKSLPKPTLLVGDSEKVYERVITKAMEIARSNGGKVSDLFQARKEFDQFVNDAIPNLYSSDAQTALRLAIRNVRHSMTDFTVEHLPPDIGLRDSLTHQSRLIDAVENMSEKAASGAQKEIGTNAIQRAAAKHPTATKVIKYGVAGAVGGGVVHATGL